MDFFCTNDERKYPHYILGSRNVTKSIRKRDEYHCNQSSGQGNKKKNVYA